MNMLTKEFSQPNPPPRRRRRNIERNREEGHNQLYNDYFMDPVYPEELFRHRFRMHKNRCTAALRVLAYGTSTDSVDEYLRMSDTSVRDSLKLFVEGIISYFGNEYLRRPNPQDLGRLLHMGQARGFPGSLNDISVLQRSPFFNDVLEESAPPVNFSANGTEYNMGYCLADGIYPGWATFVKTINAPQIQKHRYLQLNKRVVEKMWNMLLASYKLDLQFKEDNPTSTSDDPYEYHRLRRPPQERFIEIYGEIRDRATHIALKNDLIEHIWQNFRNSN
ncbi:uncharacterized protein LOC141613245 [Silene latifolia]|uniref:uncharacterized protein LOC141613245 n=1 Tax=Silene latifolia TaxID=37657 RepID=UPI003D78951E